MMVGTMMGASARRSTSTRPRELAAHQAEGERHAQRQGQHRGRPADIQGAPGGIDPLRIVEIALVPLPGKARRRELHVGRRAERDREDDQQRQHQEEVDQPAGDDEQAPAHVVASVRVKRWASA